MNTWNKQRVHVLLELVNVIRRQHGYKVQLVECWPVHVRWWLSGTGLIPGKQQGLKAHVLMATYLQGNKRKLHTLNYMQVIEVFQQKM